MLASMAQHRSFSSFCYARLFLSARIRFLCPISSLSTVLAFIQQLIAIDLRHHRPYYVRVCASALAIIHGLYSLTLFLNRWDEDCKLHTHNRVSIVVLYTRGIQYSTHNSVTEHLLKKKGKIHKEVWGKFSFLLLVNCCWWKWSQVCPCYYASLSLSPPPFFIV